MSPESSIVHQLNILSQQRVMRINKLTCLFRRSRITVKVRFGLPGF